MTIPGAAALRILIVDDNPDDAQLILLALYRGGYGPVSTRVDTAELLATALYEQVWDVITCDYAMPQFSGAAAVQAIRSRLPQTPIILVFDASNERHASHLFQAGANGFVSKQRLDALTDMIGRVLREC